MLKYIGKLCIFVVLPCFQVQAFELPSVELDKLASAQRLAARVYQETKDAAGAVKVLEEAGVQRLDKGRPSNMTLKAYIDALEAYGGYLARIEGEGDVAAGYLKTVIKADSTRASAYRSLGELYYRRFGTKPDPQYRRIYQGAFKKYVGLLQAQGRKAVLPQHIVGAVYPNVRDICALIDSLKSQRRLTDLSALFNPERQVSELDLTDPKGIHTLLGTSFDGFLQSALGPIIRSKIDVDNDGEIELRFLTQTANNCQRNLFYKKYGSQIALLSNKLLDQYYSADRICGQDTLQMVHYNNTNYILERQTGPSTVLDIQVYELRPSGEYMQHCEILPTSVLQKNLVKECDAAVCAQLIQKIDEIIAEDGQVGSEWLVSDVNAQQFVSAVTLNPALKPFANSQHQYLVDLDNDGERELISRLWSKLPDGKLEYQYRLFKLKNDYWANWNLPSPSEGIGPGPWQWFFVHFFEDQNYIVSYSASKGAGTDSSAIMQYRLVVYKLANNTLVRLGEIRTYQSMEAANAIKRRSMDGLY